MDFLSTGLELLIKAVLIGICFFTIIGLWVSTWSVIRDNSYMTYRTLKGEYIREPNISLGDKLFACAITLVFTGMLIALAMSVWML